MHLVTYLHPRLPTDSAEEPIILANNTTQYNDYSLYEANATGEEKKAYQEAHFSKDCENARQLGEDIATGKLLNP